MSTGGLSLLLAEQTQAFNFHGLQTIGKVVYLFDLVVFSTVTAAIIYRFIRFPGVFKASITHPTEGLFLGTSFLSLASIIGGMGRYGIPSCGPWLVVVYRILFWIYFAVTFLIAAGQYSLLFTLPSLKIQDMSPAWDLPIFPFMLSGTIASIGASTQPPTHAVPMIVAGLTAQGLGMIVSILMYACYIHRMIQYGFPSPNTRPGLFIAVGPPAFTSLAIIGMASGFPTTYSYFGDPEITYQILQTMATMTAVFIWSLSFWFWAIATIGCLAVWKQMTFRLNWWAFVFPNVGFTIATLTIGKQFESPGVEWVGTIMTILIVALYLFILAHHIRAFIRKDIVYEGKDEDEYINELRHDYGKADGRGNFDSESQVKEA
ncbi:voltage-dependent anion channel [Truncatella angustata]|uniref:Voltage-dependent anion channel n=1 Tax=Truncatella angustata TaxID=152316 RepID=A0A9P8UL08_9PEZI|nr:voltage-dependent anion channel [Truncatella angustata]KAH6654149.1 voltage-dependent anion channel [Truncatella angustata]